MTPQPQPASIEAGPAAPLPLVLDGVRFGYHAGQTVVDGVSASLEAGRLCTLLGPNAAGKSTLLKLMLGQLTPRAGRVTVAGRDVAALSPRERARLVAYVPQRGGSSFAFSVREVVEMARYAGGPDDAAVDRAIEACELGPITGRPFTELSGGQQQRVLVARALAQVWAGGTGGRGRLLLLDEPTSSLDLRHVHALMALLRRQAQAGLAVLVVMHDLNVAARYADDAWLLDAGRIVAAGPWQAVLRPERLEPVYRVRLGLATLVGGSAGTDRPVFVAEPEGKLG